MEKNKKKREKPELLSACIIVFSLLLCIGVSAVEYGMIRQGLDEEAREAAAKVSEADYVQLDDPLLVLVNDQVPIPDDWEVTPRMIDDEIVDLRMYESLLDMFHAAEEEEIWFWVASGYRSAEEQEIVLDRAVQENLEAGMGRKEAEELALRTISKPGHSEHHTGLAVDLNDVSDDFELSAAYAWLQMHAAEYGFVQRYQKGKESITGIDAESWHYRYVGPEHAMAMQRMRFCLEEYVEHLRENGEE